MFPGLWCCRVTPTLIRCDGTRKDVPFSSRTPSTCGDGRPASGRRAAGDRRRRRGGCSRGGLLAGAAGTGGRRGRLAALGRGRARRSGRRLRRKPAGDRGRDARHDLTRRGVDRVCTRFRDAERARPLRPGLADRPAGRRRVPLRRSGVRPPGRAARAAPGPADRPRGAAGPISVPGERGRRLGFLGAVRPSGRVSRCARVRARGLRPPAVDPVLVGDHRRPEGDRPRPRRDPGRAPEVARAGHGHPGGRPLLLLQLDELDGLELPGRRAAARRDDRALRRQPRPSRSARRLAGGRFDVRDDVWVRRRLRVGVREGEPGSRRRARSAGSADGDPDGRLGWCAA